MKFQTSDTVLNLKALNHPSFACDVSFLSPRPITSIDSQPVSIIHGEAANQDNALTNSNIIVRYRTSAGRKKRQILFFIHHCKCDVKTRRIPSFITLIPLAKVIDSIE